MTVSDRTNEACLSAQTIQLWLDHQLDDLNRIQVSRHLETCHACQTIADTIVAGTVIRPVAIDELSASFSAPADFPEFLGQLKDLDRNETADNQTVLDVIANGDPRHRPETRKATASNGTNWIDDDTAPGTNIGHYRLVSQLGQGGFGVVYLAEQDQPLRRTVAIKVVRPGMGSRDVIERFDIERQALALMDHPNIARVLDGGTTARGQPYFVMEFVDGEPVTRYCDRCRLPIRQRLALFVTVCQAVQHAHQKGIIHRDLKPSNVLVRERDGVAEAKVIDFGVAKALTHTDNGATTITATGQIVGTWAYMSPEQIGLTEQDIDTRCDVYSLGVLLFELLTGTTPFDRKGWSKSNFLQALQTLELDPPRPSGKVSTIGNDANPILEHRRATRRELSRMLRGDLDWIVLKALEKDRDRRYESAGALAADVERYLRIEPVEASSPSTVYRLKKYLRRNRFLLSAVTAVIAALLFGLGLALSQARRADRELTRAEQAEQAQRQQTDRAENLLYAAEIRLASQHHQEGDDEKAEVFLNHWVPEAGAPDRRGIEWRILTQSMQVSHRELMRLPGVVSLIRISPDQAYVAAATDGGAVCRFEFATQRELPSWDTNLEDVRRIEFSPGGKWMAVISYEGETAVLDTSTGDVRYRFPRDADNRGPADVEFLDDKTLLTTGAGPAIRIWDLENGSLRGRWSESSSLNSDLKYSPGLNGLAVLFRGQNGYHDALCLFNPSSGVILRNFTLDSPSAARSLALSSTGEYAAVGFLNGEIHVIDWDNHRLAKLALSEEAQEIAFSPDDELIAVAERTGALHVWKWRNQGTVDLEPATNSRHIHRHWRTFSRPARSVVFMKDQNLVISAGQDGRIIQWDYRHPPGQRIINAHRVGGLTWVEGRRALAFLSGVLHLVDRATGKELTSLPLPKVPPIGKLSETSDGCHLAWSTHEGPIWLWNACSEAPPRVVPGSIATKGYFVPEFSTELKKLIALRFDDTRIKCWDIESNMPVSQWNFPSGLPRREAFAPQDSRMYLLTYEELLLVNLATGIVDRRWNFDGRPATCLASSSRGDLLAIGRNDRLIDLVNVDDASICRTLVGHQAEIIQLQFTTDGQTLLALDKRGVLKFWQTSQGADVSTWPSNQPIVAFKLSPDGHWLAVSGEDTITIVEIAPLGSPLE